MKYIYYSKANYYISHKTPNIILYSVYNYPKHPENKSHSIYYLHEIESSVYMKYNTTPK